MGKFSIVVTSLSALALVAGWMAGGRPAETPKPRSEEEARPVLTALDSGNRPSRVAAGLWERLDAMEDIGDFPEIVASLDAQTLVGILETERRWTSARWYQLQAEVCRRLGEIDPELALRTARRLDDFGLHLSRAAFMQLAQSLDGDELTARLEAVEGAEWRKFCAIGLASGLAKIDPQRALAFAQGQSASARPELLAAVYTSWVEHDPAAASAALLEIRDHKERADTAASLIGRWASNDEVAAMAWAKTIKHRALRSQSVSIALSYLAARDLQRAAAELLAIGAGDFDDRELIYRDGSGGYDASGGHVVDRILASLGPGSAAGEDFLLALPAAVRDQIFSRNSELDSEIALSIAEKLPPGSAGQTGLIEAAIPGIAEQDYRRALDLLDSIPEHNRQTQMLPVFAAWIKEDAAGAFQFLSDNPKALPEWGASLLLDVVPEDARELLERIDALPESVNLRGEMRGIVIGELFQSDPAGAMEAASSDSTLLANLAGTWAQHDQAALDRWLQTRGEDERAAVLAGTVKSSLGSDPQAAAAQLVALSGLELDDKTVGSVDELARSVASALAKQSFSAAGEWISSLQPGGVANAAAYEVAELWATVDAAATSAWIRELPSGSARDSAANALVEKIIQSDPAAALTWTESIADPEIRNSSIDNVIGILANSDPAAAARLAELAEGDEAIMSAAFALGDVWFSSDPLAARGWIDGLPPGLMRDGASFAILEPLADSDLPAAFRLADELSNELFFGEVVDYFIDEEPQAFRAAVESLPEGARRTELMKLIK